MHEALRERTAASRREPDALRGRRAARTGSSHRATAQIASGTAQTARRLEAPRPPEDAATSISSQ